MREFIDGTDFQFNNLKESLNDNLCHVFKNCVLPSGCNRTTCRIGFEKGDYAYVLLIDSGITCSNSKASQLFKDWLTKGELKFIDFTDLKVFLRSLKCLY